MRNQFSILMFAICFSAVSLFVHADESPATSAASAELPNGAVAVHLKGTLSVSTRLKKGADPDSRPQDDAAWELSNVTVDAGGTAIELDWRGSDAIRNELLWWRVPRHGDFRSIQADVTGRMTFKAVPNAPDRNQTTRRGATKRLVPVVAVQTLKVQLAGADGRPSGPQFDRKEVKAK